MQQNISEEINQEINQETNKIAQVLQINLPGSDLPVLMRIIALLLMVGGLSIVGGVFSDIIKPPDPDIPFYFLRFAVGIVTISISYGILTKRRWSIWLYGLVLAVGFKTNPIFTILPAAVIVYLYFNRRLFAPFILDYLFNSSASKIKEFVKNNIFSKIQIIREKLNRENEDNPEN